MRIEDEQTGGIIFLGIERLCPAPSYPIHVKRRRVARGSKRLATAKKTDAPSLQVSLETESEGADGSRTPQSATADGGGLRFFAAEADARQIPNPS